MGYFFSLVKNIDKLLLVLPLLFAAVSITLIASITYTGGGLLNRATLVQGVCFVIGYFAILFILLIDYKIFERYEKLLYAASLLFLFTVYVPGLGTDMNTGSHAWIDLGVTTMQPSEIVKISFVLVFANFLSRNASHLLSLRGVFFAALYAAPFLGIIMKEDFGSGLVLAVMCVGMVFYAGIDRRLFSRLAVAFLVAIPILFRFMKDYQKRRIDAFLHPENLSIQETWQVYQSKIAIGSGGLFGKGLFSGTQKELDFLPVQESDFIFAVAVEELGLVGGAAILLLYLAFFLRIWRTVGRAKDMYGALIVVGILCMFAFQAFENIGMNMGIMPVTGIPLPLVSAGGTAVVANLIAVGFVLNVGIRNKTINF
ncbi:MAG: rod shape-determining protein RodA [Clostridiales Family XIII bacterium]|jgi:rod shape determining protein RodA|nr:rod shape-determining protein RodA [Clostridiales Family XIII bacterium]